MHGWFLGLLWKRDKSGSGLHKNIRTVSCYSQTIIYIYIYSVHKRRRKRY